MLTEHAQFGNGELNGYLIQVRASGGTAKNVRLVVNTQRPVLWTEFPAECRANVAGLQLSCPLGDVGDLSNRLFSVRFPFTLGPGEGRSIIAMATADNAHPAAASHQLAAHT